MPDQEGSVAVNTPLNNLPLQLTSFVGRERELAEVARLLLTTRLLTLTGAGGSGKTRLALEVASQLLKGFPGGGLARGAGRAVRPRARPPGHRLSPRCVRGAWA